MAVGVVVGGDGVVRTGNKAVSGAAVDVGLRPVDWSLAVGVVVGGRALRAGCAGTLSLQRRRASRWRPVRVVSATYGLVVPLTTVVVAQCQRGGGAGNLIDGETDADTRRSGCEPWCLVRSGRAVARTVHGAQMVTIFTSVRESGEGVGRGGRVAARDGCPGAPAAEVARASVVVVDVVLVAGDGRIGRI